VFNIVHHYNICGLILQQEDALVNVQTVYLEIILLCLVLKCALITLMQISLIISVFFRVSLYMLMTILNHVLKYAQIPQQLVTTHLDASNFVILEIICMKRFAIKLALVDYSPTI
jgi:hypothetical protein